MNRRFGAQTMVAPLKRVLVKRPEAAVDDPERWHYTSRPILEIAQQEHDFLVRRLEEAGAEVIHHDEPQPERADSIFVFDPALITNEGAVILSMGKELRRGEEEVMANRFEELDIPILYTLHGDARAEGGDLLWLDESTLAVGIGFRTNREGFFQLEKALSKLSVSVVPYDLPYFTGPDACLHLLSLISLVKEKAAVVYPPLLPVPFWQELNRRGITLIEVPEEEFFTMGTNVLALAPGKCLVLEGNPLTRKKLEEAGCQVVSYKGDELSLKAEGGPTCLTRPILRE